MYIVDCYAKETRKRTYINLLQQCYFMSHSCPSLNCLSKCFRILDHVSFSGDVVKANNSTRLSPLCFRRSRRIVSCSLELAFSKCTTLLHSGEVVFRRYAVVEGPQPSHVSTIVKQVCPSVSLSEILWTVQKS